MRALRNAGHEIVECRDVSRGLLKYIRLLQHLRAMKGSYDVIIVGYPGHVVVSLARLFGGAPVVSDLLGSLSDAAKNTYDAGFLMQMWYSWVDRLAIACSDVVLVDSELQKEYLERRYGSGEKYRVVYTGADEEVFGPRGGRDVADSKLFVALFRGRLIPQSGIMHILDAAEALQNDTRFAFRIIGYGPLLAAVQERVKGLSNVELISAHISFDEMRRLMLDADASLGQFGDNERSDRNIPHKAFESIAMGIPYLTARVPGISELLEDEVSCLMVSLEDSAAIKTALERLRDDRPLGRRLAEKARAVYESQASARVIASTITAISASCIEARKRLVTRGFQWLGKREVMVVLLLLAFFVAIRLPGLDLPYHQDEAKIGHMVRVQHVGYLAAHPPLTELIYRKVGMITGSDNLRIIPLSFATFSAAFLYFIMRRRVDAAAALWSVLVYSVCMYGVFASLMVDTDGAILPTFFLLAVYAYDRFRQADAMRGRLMWIGGVFAALLLGFLTKLSFVLVLGALVLDYLFEIRKRARLSTVVFVVAVGAACAIVGGILLWAAQHVFEGINLRETIAHAALYFRLEGRGYLQIVIQGVKAVFYLSPLILIPVVFVSRADLLRTRIFVTYILLGGIFYFILFDFSQAALDKYLMFLVVPLAAISGTVIARVLPTLSRREMLLGGGLGVIFAIALLFLNFLSPRVVPLYPKQQWILDILHGHWNTLFVFTGGDGPVGVYLSLLFIGASFIACLALLIVARFRFRSLLVSVLVICVAYNAVFVQEFLYGTLNGSAKTALHQSLDFIRTHDVGAVITHGEIGKYELDGMDKYAGRFYAVPGNEEGHKERFAGHDGSYLVINVPRFNIDSFYARFFAQCSALHATRSGEIEATIYDCDGVDPHAIQ
jgi:glycosyltransferase involved in cell wall biosynthesis